MKKIVILAVAAAMASLSQASELYWTVANPLTVDGNSQTWETAKLFVNDTGYNFGSTVVLDTVTAEQMADWGTWNTELGTYGNAAYSFYVELYNSSGSIGKSYVSTSTPQGAQTYTALAEAGAIYDSGSIMNPTASAYSGFSSFTTSNVVPEPTSGLLVLFGMMALGLKRKSV